MSRFRIANSGLVQVGVTSTPRGRDMLESRFHAVPDRIKPGLQRKLRRRQLSPSVLRRSSMKVDSL